MADSSVNRILDVIDAGLQTPVPDPTFGEISPKDEGGCLRCGDTWLDEGEDFCGGCRAFLLGDSDVDPLRPTPVTLQATVVAACETFAEAMRRIADQINNALAPVLAALPDTLLESAAKLNDVYGAAETLGLDREAVSDVIDEELDQAQAAGEEFDVALDHVMERLRFFAERGTLAMDPGGNEREMTE